MSDDGFRQALDGIEARIVAGGARDGAVALAYLAGQLVAPTGGGGPSRSTST